MPGEGKGSVQVGHLMPCPLSPQTFRAPLSKHPRVGKAGVCSDYLWTGALMWVLKGESWPRGAAPLL